MSRGTSTMVYVSFLVLLLKLAIGMGMPSVEATSICAPDAPTKMRQLCMLASLEQYLASENQPHGSSNILQEAPLYDRGIKRQDVDHVFLRFGRRVVL